MTGLSFFRCAFVLLLAALLAGAARADEFAPLQRSLDMPGGANVPLLVSPEWDGSNDARAVVVIHGLGRDAPGYFRALASSRAKARAEAILVAPHFLADEDFLAPGQLHWARGGWMGGSPAHGPTSASAFDVIDAILAHLADRSHYPALREVVVIGHSAGAQLVQRYVAVGRGVPASLAVRFVVANPSSYLWFSPDRPGSTFACPSYNHWKYGLAGHLPPYVTDPPATLEARYVARDVTYLIGGDDTDPTQRDLDRSCGGEAQGSDRFARHTAFLADLAARHGSLATQRSFTVPGVGHSGGHMIDSACGIAVLFGSGRCE